MITLRQALQALKDELPRRNDWSYGMLSFPNRSMGICGNVCNYLETNLASSDDHCTADNQLQDLIDKYIREKQLTYYSNTYPVGGMEEYEREQRKGSIWDNQRRMAMLDWLLEHCE